MIFLELWKHLEAPLAWPAPWAWQADRPAALRTGHRQARPCGQIWAPRGQRGDNHGPVGEPSGPGRPEERPGTGTRLILPGGAKGLSESPGLWCLGNEPSSAASRLGVTLTWGDRRQAPLCRGPQTKVSESLTVWQPLGWVPKCPQVLALAISFGPLENLCFWLFKVSCFWELTSPGVLSPRECPWGSVQPRGRLCVPVGVCVTPWKAV